MKKMNKKSKQRMLAGVALIVVVILVASSLFVYYEYYKEEEVKEEPVIVQIDDRISPLENQALVLEVKRIRHRGIHGALLTRGRSWRQPPSFYFVADLDGLEYQSRNVAGSMSTKEVLFNTWDSMFQENKIVRDAEEEQETSKVTLSVVERQNYGFLNRKTRETEKDKFSVVYDYRTGRWSGDDYFMDEDGYGYYLGNTYEIWFNIYQMDYDADYIPYWTEVNILGTDPMRSDVGKDPDGDGVDTFWEWKWGYDPNVWEDHEKLDPDIDGIENIEEFQIAKWLSDPYQQNVYCEVDHMEGTSKFDGPHILDRHGLLGIVEMYSQHNIKLFFDDGWPDTPAGGGGSVLKHYNAFSQDSGMILQYYDHNFPDERKGIFRYVVGVHGGPFNHPARGNIYDCITVGFVDTPRQRFKQSINTGFQIGLFDRNIALMNAQTLMHELGHSIGLHPWTFEGCDNRSFSTSTNTWTKNYISVMNYATMYKPSLLDYSDGSNGAPYDQEDWKHIFVADFQYNNPQVEEIFFEPPSFDKIVYGETEHGVTGYSYDEKLTEAWKEEIRDYTPVDPIPANWLVFKINKDYKNENPEAKNVKVLVQPDLNFVGWAEYAEGDLNSAGEIKIYSQQEMIDSVMERITSQ